MAGDKKKKAFATRTIHAGQSPDPTTGAIMQPIYATSTYVQSSPGVHQGYEYSRTQNPTRMAYERCIADLESGSHGFAFASGMAATGTILELVDSGSHIIAMDDLYGGTRRLFSGVRTRSSGLDFSYVDLSDVEQLQTAFRDNTRLVWIETPTNPLLKIVDLEAVIAIAKQHGALVVVDNTFATPYASRRSTSACRGIARVRNGSPNGWNGTSASMRCCILGCRRTRSTNWPPSRWMLSAVSSRSSSRVT